MPTTNDFSFVNAKGEPQQFPYTVSETLKEFVTHPLDNLAQYVEENKSRLLEDKVGAQIGILHQLAAVNLPQHLKLLIEPGANVCQGDRFGRTPLHVAAKFGKVENLNLLINTPNEIDIDIVNTLGETPLYVAVSNCNINSLKTLIKAGAIINQGTSEHHTPLYEALRQGYKEVIKVLIEAENNPETKKMDGQNAYNIFFSAVREGNLYVITTLIEAGIDIKKVDMSNQYPLDIAIFRGHLEVVKILVQAGASIDTGTYFAPLYYALALGRENIIKFLLGAGATIPIPDGLLSFPEKFDSIINQARSIDAIIDRKPVAELGDLGFLKERPEDYIARRITGELKNSNGKDAWKFFTSPLKQTVKTLYLLKKHGSEFSKLPNDIINYIGADLAKGIHSEYLKGSYLQAASTETMGDIE